MHSNDLAIDFILISFFHSFDTTKLFLSYWLCSGPWAISYALFWSMSSLLMHSNNKNSLYNSQKCILCELNSYSFYFSSNNCTISGAVNLQFKRISIVLQSKWILFCLLINMQSPNKITGIYIQFGKYVFSVWDIGFRLLFFSKNGTISNEKVDVSKELNALHGVQNQAKY